MILDPAVAKLSSRVSEHVLLMVGVDELGRRRAAEADAARVLRSQLARRVAGRRFVRQDRFRMNQHSLVHVVQKDVAPTKETVSRT